MTQTHDKRLSGIQIATVRVRVVTPRGELVVRLEMLPPSTAIGVTLHDESGAAVGTVHELAKAFLERPEVLSYALSTAKGDEKFLEAGWTLPGGAPPVFLRDEELGELHRILAFTIHGSCHVNEGSSPKVAISLSGGSTAAGLPVRTGEVRFAIGAKDGQTSNSWRFWATAKGDVYVACRDNLKEAKVSLHVSGRWRMAFTEEAIRKRPELAAGGRNRAWEVWDPPAPIGGVIPALHLFFPGSEVVLRPAQRPDTLWKKNHIFVGSSSEGEITVVTVYITENAHELTTTPGACQTLACLGLPNGKFAQLVAHIQQTAGFEKYAKDVTERITANIDATRAHTQALPDAAYDYIFGRWSDGARYLVGMRHHRSP